MVNRMTTGTLRTNKSRFSVYVPHPYYETCEFMSSFSVGRVSFASSYMLVPALLQPTSDVLYPGRRKSLCGSVII